MTIPPIAASSLVHGRIVRLSDVHLDMASDAGTVNILRGITLDIAAGEPVVVRRFSLAPDSEGPGKKAYDLGYNIGGEDRRSTSRPSAIP